MILINNIRRKLFWLVDFLNGADVYKNYKEIKFLFENYFFPDAIKMRQTYLEGILNFARKNVPYYRQFSKRSFLEDFPVINKNIIRDNQNLFFTDGFKLKKFHKVTTSGSTGAPLTIWQDRKKRIRHTAENIYFSELAGYIIGTRLYYLRVWNRVNKKSFFESLLQNIVMVDASDLSERNFELFLKEIERDSKTKSILAFSSTFEALAQYIVRTSRKIRTKVNCLLTISETLPEGARNILKEAFQCPVISRYSNMENGFLAQQCGDESGEYHVNTTGFHIELLHPEKDEPVQEGEAGRIIVTDLFNYAMPIIRYDTGDIAILSEKSACGRFGPVFVSVEGRRVDYIYNTEGKLLSPHVITNTMWEYSSEIKQFQFIQNGKNDYILKLNCRDSYFTRENELLSDVKKFLGADAKIKFEYINEIPQLASGKRKKIINNLLQK